MGGQDAGGAKTGSRATSPWPPMWIAARSGSASSQPPPWAQQHVGEMRDVPLGRAKWVQPRQARSFRRAVVKLLSRSWPMRQRQLSASESLRPADHLDTAELDDGALARASAA